MKEGGPVFGWIAVGFAAGSALVALLSGAFLAALLFAVAAVPVLPAGPLCRLWQRSKPKKAIAIVAAGVLMIAGCVLLFVVAPASDKAADAPAAGGATGTTTAVPSTTTTAVVVPATTTTTVTTVTTTTAITTTTTATTTATTPPSTATVAVTGAGSTTAGETAIGQVVYRTPSGKRYHLNPHCGGKNSYEVSLGEAQTAGLTPCQKCAGG